MSELYEDLLWFRRMDDEMDKFVKNSCGDVEGHVNSRLGDWPHRTRTVLSLPLGNSKAVKPISEYQASPAGLRITEAPEPHEPTKVLGWLLVGFAGFCLFVLVWAIARTLR